MLINFYYDEDSAEKFKRMYYPHNKRFVKDCEVISKYKKYIDDMRNYDTSLMMEYNKLKPATLELILNERLSKHELLIILYLLGLYRNNFNRDYKPKTIDVLRKIFKCHNNYDMYKKIWVSTLNKLKKWEYKDGSLFIYDCKIESKNTVIMLDKSTKTK
jgi:hypothetical protein